MILTRFFQPIDPPRAVQVMAHRSIMSAAPENTLPGFQQAIDAGVEWIETDVRLTRDGHHVVLHDPAVDRTTDGAGLVRETDLATLKALDAGSWFSPEYAGTRLPTNPEILAFCRGRINLYLDCKHVDPALLVREIREAGMERQVVVFDRPETLEEVRRISGGTIAVMPSINKCLDVSYWMKRLSPEAVEIHAHLLTPELVRGFHDAGVIVQAQTLGKRDHPAVWRGCLEIGVDWIQTDRAGDLLAELLA